jgi:hypothetical protein
MCAALFRTSLAKEKMSVVEGHGITLKDFLVIVKFLRFQWVQAPIVNYPKI